MQRMKSKPSVQATDLETNILGAMEVKFHEKETTN